MFIASMLEWQTFDIVRTDYPSYIVAIFLSGQSCASLTKRLTNKIAYLFFQLNKNLVKFFIFGL